MTSPTRRELASARWRGLTLLRATRPLRRVLWATATRAALATFCTPLTVTGAEHLRAAAGPVVLAANHSSHADTALMQLLANRHRRGKLIAAAADDYFFSSPLRSLAATTLIGAVPFPRRGAAGLRRAKHALEVGYDVLLFPQGTRAGGPFRSGVGHLAAAAPVVPVALTGCQDLLPRGQRWPTRTAVHVRIGAPLHLAHLDADAATAAVERAVTDLLGDADTQAAA